MMGVLEGWVQWVWLLVSLSFTRDRTWLQCLVSLLLVDQTVNHQLKVLMKIPNQPVQHLLGNTNNQLLL